MFNRLPQKINHSFILLGPRGSGKSTWLKKIFGTKTTHFINLLDLKTQRVLIKHPEKLSEMLDKLGPEIKWVVIDEIQKIPLLLDTVHDYIEKTKLKFALSGSSARKLRKGTANLLAGRAFEMRMYPLTSFELGKKSHLQKILEWGTLPKVYSLKKDLEKQEYLLTYAHLYVKEEIKEEQVVRKLDPFIDFLSVAAQSDTQIINFSKIATDIGVDTATVISYFKILEDTFLGQYLLAYHTSIRKRQRQNPKFYFFDTGVRRALDGTIGEPIPEGRKEYGRLFEGFLVNEIFRLNWYLKRLFEFSYINADEDSEIDLIIEKAKRAQFLVEIKSTSKVEASEVASLNRYSKDFPEATLVCLSNDKNNRVENKIHFFYWKDGLDFIFPT